MSKKWTSSKSMIFFVMGCITLIAGIVICVVLYHPPSYEDYKSMTWLETMIKYSKGTLITAIIGVVIQIIIWYNFFKDQGWFSSRHEDGGSSVK